MSLSDVLTSAYGATFVLLVAFVKTVKTLYEFHDEYLIKRRFKHLNFLKSEAMGNEDLIRFVDLAKQELVFAGTLGRSASPRLSLAIMELYKTRLFSVWELRTSRYYIHLDDRGLIEVRPGRFGIALAAFAFLFLVGIAGYVAPVVLKLVATKQLTAIATAAAMLLGFFLMGLYLLRDTIEVAIAWRVGRQLKKYQRQTSAAASAAPAIEAASLRD